MAALIATPDWRKSPDSAGVVPRSSGVASHRRGRISLVALRVGLTGLSLTTVVACGGDTAGPNPPSNPNALWSLTFQWPAVNLALTAPYDTVQLVAVPRTATGVALSNVGPVQYSTTDSTISVDSTGLVTARFVTGTAHVVARMTVDGVTLEDTAIVQVTSAPFPYPLATLSIQPDPESDGLAAAQTTIDNDFTVVPFFATIATGDPATDTLCTADDGCSSPFLVHYASSDSTIATIDQYGDVTPYRVGRVIFTISTIAYGVKKVDSLPFSIGYKTQHIIYNIIIDSSQKTPALADNGSRGVPISVGTKTFICNATGDSLEITLPESSSGVSFQNPTLTQVKDTVTESCGKPYFYYARVEFDSAGTYTLHYRALHSGATLAESVTVFAYP